MKTEPRWPLSSTERSGECSGDCAGVPSKEGSERSLGRKNGDTSRVWGPGKQGRKVEGANSMSCALQMDPRTHSLSIGFDDGEVIGNIYVMPCLGVMSISKPKNKKSIQWKQSLFHT